jgi:hypothetical protein
MGENTFNLPQPGKPYPAGSDRPYEHERMEGEDRADDATFLRVLDETSRLAAGSGLPYAFMGGLASTALGRNRWTHDIDLLVRQEDARDLLRVFADAGYDTEERDQAWLYKAYRHGVMIDFIFAVRLPAGDRAITLDEQMLARTREADFNGVRLRVVAPEDLLVIKAVSHQEFRSRHWFDALGLIAAGGLDWDHLVQRATRYGPRRVLSLLIYAQTDGLDVPDEAIQALYEQEPRSTGRRVRGVYPEGGRSIRRRAPDAAAPENAPEGYLVGRIMDRFARDPRTAELEVDVELDDGVIVLTGCVATPERRDALTEVARSTVPDRRVRNLVTLAGPAAGPRTEPTVEHVEAR